MGSQGYACSSGAMGAGFHGQKSANQPGQVYEAIKDCVRAKVFWRNSGVAEPNGKDRDPCASGGGDVGLAVADHDRERQCSARSQDKLRDVAWVRFVEGKRIAARFRVEESCDAKRGQEPRHKSIELVRTECEPCALAAQHICRFEKAREQPRLDCDVLLVMLHKPVGEPLHLRPVGNLSGRVKRVIEHRARSISYAPPDRVCRRRQEAFSDEGGIRRVDEVGGRIGNRPIEVENDRGTVDGLPPSILSALAADVIASSVPLAGGRTQALRPNRAAFWPIHVRFARAAG